jgi:hypothetical protein
VGEVYQDMKSVVFWDVDLSSKSSDIVTLNSSSDVVATINIECLLILILYFHYFY